ncbi:endoglucanase [Novosphingobium sp. PhB165]|uniref:glycosyl hydrolase family 8 n=1 Tax=Novosphingobium sp. PhB165 TaxID=2485105 RepID=UPI00104F21DA|nr:glycosyl hydrolase family 8 [Novosphingobium sp. PhB165]TCM20765.1 endoglucanase [Novosphingobium sp. PhB165]
MASDETFRGPRIDRRKFTLAAMLTLTAACNGGAQSRTPGRPATWSSYRELFLSQDGRIVDTGNKGVSHSEGQSYGLAFALDAGDREAFDRIAKWTREHLARPDVALHSWRFDPTAANPVADRNNATDGDIIIAWALGLAGQRWNHPEYTARAAEIRAAIASHCVIERYGRKLLLPGIEGFVTDAGVTLNSSYFVWPALDAFALIDGQQSWAPIIADCEAIAKLARFGTRHLPVDWMRITGPSQLAPAPDKPPRFGYDAIRVPLWASLGGRPALVDDVDAYWRSSTAAGRPIPAWIDVMSGEEAPYAISSGGAAVASLLLGTQKPAILADDYYSASLQLLSGLHLVR